MQSGLVLVFMRIGLNLLCTNIHRGTPPFYPLNNVTFPNLAIFFKIIECFIHNIVAHDIVNKMVYKTI